MIKIRIHQTLNYFFETEMKIIYVHVKTFFKNNLVKIICLFKNNLEVKKILEIFLKEFIRFISITIHKF